MYEHDATEQAYKNGYEKGVTEFATELVKKSELFLSEDNFEPTFVKAVRVKFINELRKSLRR